MTPYIGILEWWFKNGMPYPPHVIAEQVGILLDRNLKSEILQVNKLNSKEQFV